MNDELPDPPRWLKTLCAVAALLVAAVFLGRRIYLHEVLMHLPAGEGAAALSDYLPVGFGLGVLAFLLPGLGCFSVATLVGVYGRLSRAWAFNPLVPWLALTPLACWLLGP